MFPVALRGNFIQAKYETFVYIRCPDAQRSPLHDPHSTPVTDTFRRQQSHCTTLQNVKAHFSQYAGYSKKKAGEKEACLKSILL